MPNKSDTHNLKPEHDKRRKLTPAQYSAIREEYNTGTISQRGLARKYGVSRRSIVFILYPERLEASRKNRDWRKYHDRKALTNATRNLRRRKHMLYGKHSNRCTHTADGRYPDGFLAQSRVSESSNSLQPNRPTN